MIYALLLLLLITILVYLKYEDTLSHNMGKLGEHLIKILGLSLLMISLVGILADFKENDYRNKSKAYKETIKIIKKLSKDSSLNIKDRNYLKIKELKILEKYKNAQAKEKTYSTFLTFIFLRISFS